MFRRSLRWTLDFVRYTIQYGCIGHCAFEYIGEFVVVSIYLNGFINGHLHGSVIKGGHFLKAAFLNDQEN